MSKNLILLSLVLVLLVGVAIYSEATTWWYSATNNAEFWSTTDQNFTSWSQKASPGYYARGLTTDPSDGTIYMACEEGNGRIIKSTNNGASWTFVGNAGGTQPRGIVCNRAGELFVASENGYCYKSTNKGASWSQISNFGTNPGGGQEIPRGITSGVSSTDGKEYLYVALESHSGKVTRSTNNGASWSTQNPAWSDKQNVQYYDPIVADANGYVYLMWEQTEARVYYSTNQAQGWSHRGSPNYTAKGLGASKNGYLLVSLESDGRSNSGILKYSSNQASGWSDANSNMDSRWSRHIEAYPRLNMLPKPTVLTPTAGETNKNQPTISWTFSDDDGYQAMYQVRIGTTDGGSDLWSPAAVSSSANSVVVDQPLPDGTAYVQVRLHDGTEWGEWMASGIQINVATEVHVNLGSVTTPTNDITVTQSGTAIVGPPGAATVDEVHFRVDAGAWFEATADDGAFDEDIEPFNFTTFPLLDGVHLMEVRAIDSNSNESDYGTTSVTVDTKEPNSELNPITSPTNINPPTITGTATD